MKTIVVTILHNRSDLTLRTLKSFYNDNVPSYHIFVDNNSTDDTHKVVCEFMQNRPYEYVSLDTNIGIASALTLAINKASNYTEKDLVILKLDNDVEMVSQNLLQQVGEFYGKMGYNFVISPRDTMIEKSFEPNTHSKLIIKNGQVFTYTSHVGGACCFLPVRAALHLAKYNVEKDFARGWELRQKGFGVGYLEHLQFAHIGLNKSTEDYKW